MSFNSAACTTCGQPLRPTAQFCDACGASTRPAVTPVEVVRRAAPPPPPRPSLAPIIASAAALVAVIIGLVVWRTRDRAPEPTPVAQRAERPPGMSSKSPEPADVGMSDAPGDVADETGRDEIVDLPPDEPSPLPPPRRVQALPQPDPPVAREIVVAPTPPSPSRGRTSGPPTAPPNRRDEPVEPPNRRDPARPSTPPPPPPATDEGPLWDAYATARANAASPGAKDPAVMRSEFCAAAARTLRDGQGRDVGRIRSDQRRFGC